MQCTTVPRVKYLDVNNLLSTQRKASIISMAFLHLLDIDSADVNLILYFYFSFRPLSQRSKK